MPRSCATALPWVLIRAGLSLLLGFDPGGPDDMGLDVPDGLDDPGGPDDLDVADDPNEPRFGGAPPGQGGRFEHTGYHGADGQELHSTADGTLIDDHGGVHGKYDSDVTRK